MSSPDVVSSLTDFATADEISRLSTIVGHERPHPIHLLLEREGGLSQHRVNVDNALRQVSIANRPWLDKMKGRIIGKDVTEASATLAELRAYGYLLEAGFSVNPIAATNQRATPEFIVSDGVDEFVVEVHAKQQNAETEKELSAQRKAIADEPRESGKITTHVHVVHPWGRPSAEKKGDSTTKKAISRICAIKGREHQLRADIPSVVWMDFQDLHTWDMALGPEQFNPLLSWRDHITSGAIYYALYGWKGAPVYEQVHYSHLDLPSQIQQMEHDGRFRLSTLASAVIVSLPTATILAETPRTARQLSPSVRLRCLGLPHAGLQHSIAEWTTGQVASTLNANAKLICGLIGEKPPVDYLAFASFASETESRSRSERLWWTPIAALIGASVGYLIAGRRKR